MSKLSWSVRVTARQGAGAGAEDGWSARADTSERYRLQQFAWALLRGIRHRLKHWPADQAKALGRVIAANANKGNYAVFDMDNTSYRYDRDLSPPYMENKGLITRENSTPP